MKIRTNPKFQTFNDGVLKAYSLKNVAEEGCQPVMELTEKAECIPFERRRVGLQRFADARQDNVTIEMLLRIPAEFNISPQDVCIVGGVQYAVYQIQDAPTAMPRAKDLSLQRTDEDYDITGL